MSSGIIFHIFFLILTYGIFTYSVLLLLSYVFIGLYSIGETKKYLYKNSFTDYRILAVSTHAPSVSILAPAYNEGMTIVDNVRSLLSIYYNNLELIVINDGSKDDCLRRLIDAYELEIVDFFVHYQVATKPVRGVYKSRNPVYGKLIVVDKVNGGKADALNAGINIASHNYLVCIDVDCILEQDALLKMIKPFLEETDEKMIAAGGVIRIANSCEIEAGRLLKVRMPRDYLPRMQILEYIRAFILGRMAWSRLNGLMLISGAFGAFDREIVLKCGGYDHDTVGEDMELVVRMRRYMEEHHLKYRVSFIPDPLCWTEAPASFTILGRQRNRWTRGTFETLKFHRKMFFNPKYRVLGMLSYPYWFFFEMCSPLIEFFGFIFFFLFVLMGMIDWKFFSSFLLFVICFGYLYSAFAVLMEVLTYNQYKRRIDVMRLLFTGMTEPFYFHPFVVWSAIKGFADLLRKKKSWGEMTRQGFAQPVPAGQAPATVPGTIQPPGPLAGVGSAQQTDHVKTWPRIARWLSQAFRDYLGYAVVLWLLLSGATVFELLADIVRHGLPGSFSRILGLALLRDFVFFSRLTLWTFPLYAMARLGGVKIARVFFVSVSLLLLLIQVSLSEYFLSTTVPLGADLWGYSMAEIKQTIGAAGGIPSSLILAVVLMVAASLLAFVYLPARIRSRNALMVAMMVFLLLFLAGPVPAIVHKWTPGTEYGNNLSLNKSGYFYAAAFAHFFPGSAGRDDNPEDREEAPGGPAMTGFTYADPGRYPFYHALDTGANTLSPFFDRSIMPPNIVIVLVEGLGRAFSNRGAYLGSFTPFLDSLSGKSLYWENFLSEGGRTFAVLPSVIGSLPFARNGFDALGEDMPPHLSLLSLLEYNGYHSSFYYGGDAHFDDMDLFLKKGRISSLYDEKTFPPGYTKMPSQTGFTWGFGDRELFRHYFETQKISTTPYANVVITLSTHSPFLINDEESYLQKFEDQMTRLGFDETKKKEHRYFSNQYASILFMDNALRDFFSEYRKRADFNNTVFLITGDHRMPEIPMSDKLDRYHVPLILYSPLLRRTAKFSSVSTHFDITPSLLLWLRNSCHLRIPLYGSWMGTGLDTTRYFRNVHAYPLMQTKNDLVDFVMGDFMLNGSDLYHIGSNLGLDPVIDDKKMAALKKNFDLFKRRNEKLLNGSPLIPDSLYETYLPK